jgi:uncharacterized protein YndB with AHSA1/START domain
MPSANASPPTRSAEYVVPIAAPATAVWQALTDPRELERWFPLTANVVPGIGGEYTLRWRDAHSGDDWPILAWEPQRHLAIGMPKPNGAPGLGHVVTDFKLEERAGTTVLRVVASGFDPDAKWDTFFNGIRRGWRFELRSLRHYLEHHRGRTRIVAWARAHFDAAPDRIWSMLFGPGGWIADAPIDRATDGDRYRLTAPDGTVMSGTVCISDRPTDFAGTIDEMSDALLRLELQPQHSGYQVGIWVAAYDSSADQMDGLQRRWQEALTALAGRPADGPVPSAHP